MNTFDVIRCPYCGREYLPVEIFVPDAFFGNPDVIKRDTEGHIVSCIGKGLDPKESYICDTCNKPFKVTAKISFEVEQDTLSDFNEDYVARSNVKYTLDEF